MAILKYEQSIVSKNITILETSKWIKSKVSVNTVISKKLIVLLLFQKYEKKKSKNLRILKSL